MSHLVLAVLCTVPSATPFEPRSSHSIFTPCHSKKAMERRASRPDGHRQVAPGHSLNRVSHPKITKNKGSKASHQCPGSAGAAAKGPGSAAASGQAAVRLSKTELKRNKALETFVATATEADKLARRVNRDFSDKDEQAAQPLQQKTQSLQQHTHLHPKVSEVPATKKRKV